MQDSQFRKSRKLLPASSTVVFVIPFLQIIYKTFIRNKCRI